MLSLRIDGDIRNNNELLGYLFTKIWIDNHLDTLRFDYALITLLQSHKYTFTSNALLVESVLRKKIIKTIPYAAIERVEPIRRKNGKLRKLLIYYTYEQPTWITITNEINLPAFLQELEKRVGRID